jgi:hypothetical protein
MGESRESGSASRKFRRWHHARFCNGSVFWISTARPLTSRPSDASITRRFLLRVEILGDDCSDAARLDAARTDGGARPGQRGLVCSHEARRPREPTSPRAFLGLATSAARTRPGAISLSIASHFTVMLASKLVKPVRFPPGRAKLATNPEPTGSTLPTNTTGMPYPSAYHRRGGRSLGQT